MLSLSKKTDYALISLTYLAEHSGQVASAREIADACDLPVALLMNILKELNHCGIVSSTRGAKGGYQISLDLSTISLHELVVALEGPVRLIECAEAPTDCVCANTHSDPCRVSGHCTVQTPLQALHQRLVNFLRDVKLSELVNGAKIRL